MLSTSRRESGVGLVPGPTNPVTPGVLRITDHESSSRSHRQSRYPGKTFFWTTTFLPFLNSTTSSIGMTTSKMRSSTFIETIRLSRFDFTLFSYPA